MEWVLVVVLAWVAAMGVVQARTAQVGVAVGVAVLVVVMPPCWISQRWGWVLPLVLVETPRGLLPSALNLR